MLDNLRNFYAVYKPIALIIITLYILRIFIMWTFTIS